MLIENINCKYGEKVIYKNFNINFDDNKINCIIGKSGCGKTTLLNNISERLLEENRRISYVFQNDSLISWINIYNNLKIVVKKYLIVIGMISLYILSQLIREILELKFLSSKLEIHPLAIMLSIYIGAEIFGVIGILVGPIYCLVAKDILYG